MQPIRFAAAVIAVTVLFAQAPTVRSGAYTAAQAAEGEAAYKTECAGCHGAALEGMGRNTPPLKGEEFLMSWTTGNLDELFSRIQDTMPANRPGQLPRERNAAILAYLLRENGFAAGSSALPTAEAALKAIPWGN